MVFFFLFTLKYNVVEYRIPSLNTYISHDSLLTCIVSEKKFGMILILATGEMTFPPGFFPEYPFVIPSCSLYVTCLDVVNFWYLSCIVYSLLPKSLLCHLYFGKLTAIINSNMSSASSCLCSLSGISIKQKLHLLKLSHIS